MGFCTWFPIELTFTPNCHENQLHGPCKNYCFPQVLAVTDLLLRSCDLIVWLLGLNPIAIPEPGCLVWTHPAMLRSRWTRTDAQRTRCLLRFMVLFAKQRCFHCNQENGWLLMRCRVKAFPSQVWET